MGVPQVLATFLALGELTNFLRLGFLRYWQRQGFCSLILLQHSLDGGVDDVIAPTQELSSVGLHVTATVMCASARSSTSTAQTAINDTFIFALTDMVETERERERERGAMEKVAVAEVEELPKTIVRRVVKDKLSQFSDDGDIIIHKDGLRAFCESARIFIHYLSATANDLCKESRRQTINADDVLKAIEEIEFPEFVQPLKASLDEFRKKNAGKKAGAAKSKEAKKRKEDSSLNNEGDKGKNNGGDEGNEVEDDSHEPKQKSAGKKAGAGKSKKVNKKRKVEEVKQDNEGNEDEDDSHANE